MTALTDALRAARDRERRRDRPPYRVGIVTAVGAGTLDVRIGGETASTTLRKTQECGAIIGDTVYIIDADVPLVIGTR